MNSPLSNPPSNVSALVLDYHQRTKHRFDRYAKAPSTLDWDMQPAPFRHYTDTVAHALPLVSQLRETGSWSTWLAQPFGQRVAQSAKINRAAVGALLNLALGITAWKTLGPDRWAVRANPSSGNLHPIEAYVITAGVDNFADGVWHYDPLDHALNQRAVFASRTLPPGTLLVGLTSIMWRETWKYGERAFRYCALDCGHAIAALSYAADILGWRLVERCDLSSKQLAALLGVDRTADFPGDPSTEYECAEILLEICADNIEPIDIEKLSAAAHAANWIGVATVIDKRPLFRWPIVEVVASATEKIQLKPAQLIAPLFASQSALLLASPAEERRRAVDIILGRRSAQRFDARYNMSAAQFAAIVDMLKRVHMIGGLPRLALLFFVQRVDGMVPGIYLLPRTPAQLHELRDVLPNNCALMPNAQIPGLLQLDATSPDPQVFRRVLRSLHCHQDIAATANVAVCMLAPVVSAVTKNAADYRNLLREAGMIGQALYLQAEAVGLRGTGIGCYFDDPVHDFIGLSGGNYQSLYHFTLGLPIADARVAVGSAYPQRDGTGC